MQNVESTNELDRLISQPTDGVLEAVRQTKGSFGVLGAGGKMGFHLSSMLQRALTSVGRSDRVVTVSRFAAAEKREQFESAGFEVHTADLSDPNQVQQLPELENIFYLAGIKFGTSSNPQLLQRMNLDMPRFVAERFANARIVALSSGCVYEFVAIRSGGSSEQSATNPPGDYGKSCLGREKTFVENSRLRGTPTCLIRLNYSTELRYGVLVDIALQVLSGNPVQVDTGYVNVIWQGDAVAHIIQSIRHVDNPPFILNVTGPAILSVRELARAFGERFGRTPEFVGQERDTAWLNDASLSHRLFGTPRVSVDEMIDAVSEWLKNDGPILNKPTRFEVRNGEY